MISRRENRLAITILFIYLVFTLKVTFTTGNGHSAHISQIVNYG